MAKRQKLPISYDEILQLDLRGFNELIRRWGQEIIYEQASRCPCYNPDSGQPDFRCPVCGERGYDKKQKAKGWLWHTPRFITVIERSNDDDCLPPFNGSPFIPVRNAQITKVYYAKNLTTGETYTVDGVVDGKIAVSGATLPKLTHITEAKYQYDAEIAVSAATAAADGHWMVRITQGTIQNVTRVENKTQDEIYAVEYWGHDYIVLSGKNMPASDDEIEVDYSYISPLTGLLTNVSPELRLTAVGEVRLGDAMLSVSPEIRISYMDRLTFLRQEEKESEILVRGEEPEKLRYNEIIDIVEVFSLDRDEENRVDYSEGEDFVLKGREIVWMENKGPIDGRQYTVTYFFKPTYKVYLAMPLVRTPSNEPMPRRAMTRRSDEW